MHTCTCSTVVHPAALALLTKPSASGAYLEGQELWCYLTHAPPYPHMNAHTHVPVVHPAVLAPLAMPSASGARAESQELSQPHSAIAQHCAAAVDIDGADG
eukprot:1154363-Pelagomonas_calceolata.AAC.6